MTTHPPVYPPCPRWKKGQLQREELQRSDQTLRSGSRARISRKLTRMPRLPRLSRICQNIENSPVCQECQVYEKLTQCAKNTKNMKNSLLCQDCQEYETLTGVPRCQAVRAMGHDAHKGGHKDARDGGQHVGHRHQGT